MSAGAGGGGGGPALPPLARLLLLPVLALHVQTAQASPQDAPGGVVQRIGGACRSHADCAQIEQAQCDFAQGVCQCLPSHPIENVISCLPVASVNESCSISDQCRPVSSHAECTNGVCACAAKYYLHVYQDGVPSCLLRSEHSGQARKTPVDPVMIGILASLVLMFVIICVVLRLFSKAQFRQNRTILNSANPRLMNASFLKGPLIRSPVDELTRRNSRAASITSLRREEARPEPEPESAPAAAAAAQHGAHRGKASTNNGTDVSHVEVEMTRHPH